jgi:phage terminase small subunit
MNEAPAHLRAPERQAWEELAGRWPAGVKMPEGADFEAYLGQVARLRDAQERIATDGMIVQDARGNPVAHPALAIERSAQSEIRTWGDRFDPAKVKRRVRA